MIEVILINKKHGLLVEQELGVGREFMMVQLMLSGLVLKVMVLLMTVNH
jgi:ABC-type iron transport system FetAB permease component